jgi:hypothetical protein
MLLKLVVPYYDRRVLGGVLVKWHKANGDRVSFGDELFDLRIEEEIKIKQMPAGRSLVEAMMALQFTEKPQTPENPGEDPPDAVDTAYTRRRAHYFLRIGSSDVGRLRRICALEGDHLRVGQLVAVLTTDDQGSVPEGDEALAQAGLLRVVANPFGLP